MEVSAGKKLIPSGIWNIPGGIIHFPAGGFQIPEVGYEVLHPQTPESNELNIDNQRFYQGMKILAGSFLIVLNI